MKISLLTRTVALIIFLQACGGGGGSGSSSDGDRTISLSWVAPATRSDGSFLQLSSIAGYRIYYGETPDTMQILTDVDDSTMTTVSLNAPGSGTYFYAITAYDVYSLESDMSNTVSK